MILTVGEFIERTNSGNEIPNALRELISGEIRDDHRNGEYNSWVNSYKALAINLFNSSISSDVQIILEYNLARTPYRCDVILAGKKNGRDKILIIELKQWEQGYINSIDNRYVRAYGAVKEHPLVQVLGYKEFFQNVYTSINEYDIQVEACAYLHNYDLYENDNLVMGYENYLVDEDNRNILFGRGSSQEFESFISNAFDDSSETVVNRIITSEIRLNDAFIDNINNLIEGRPVFNPTEDQAGIIDKIIGNLNNDDTIHNVFIVKGGPGTGKTVLAFNLLLKLAANNSHNGMGLQNVTYATKNSQLVNSYLSVLMGNDANEGLPAFDNRTLNVLFSQINPILENNTIYDCLIVDESQRLQQRYKEGNKWRSDIIRKLVEKSKNIVFLLDEDQKLAFNDVEFTNQIKEIINDDSINIFPNEEESEYCLYQAFRTFGSREHLDWIDHFLGFERSKNILGRLADGYDIKVVTSPDDLIYMVHDKKNNNERARVLAGLCWQWKDEYKNDNTKADIKITIDENEYAYSWNRNDVNNWSVNKDTINEIGCVHTVLGQEFDYVGVIIGDDLTFDGQNVVPNPDANTQFMRYDNDSKRVNGMPVNAQARNSSIVLSQNRDRAKFEEAKELIRNHYHILLTRGKKGCYIYCTNNELRNHLCDLLNQDALFSYSPSCEYNRALWEADVVVANKNATNAGGMIIGNNNNHSYHRIKCQYAPRNPQKRVEFNSVDEARLAGYRPCGTCKP